MKGTVVEIRNFDEVYNTRRGYIANECDSSNLKVNIDNECVQIPKDNLYKVYCIGLPKEYIAFTTRKEYDLVLKDALQQIKSKFFYLLVMQNSLGTSIITINIKFFELMFNQMTTEPLVRVYCTSKSQSNTKIQFGQCCVHVPEDMTKPWFKDLSSEKFMNLLSRFQNIHNEECLKKLNLLDYTDT